MDKNYPIEIQKIVFDFNDIKYLTIENKTFNWANEIALSTSATSLNIKICIYTGKEIANQIFNTKKILKDNPMMKAGYKHQGDIRILTFLPFYHIFGLVATYFWFAFFGRTFVFLKDMSNETILKTIKKHKVTHVFSVPMMWNTIYKKVMKQVNSFDQKTQKKFQRGIKISLAIQNVFPMLGIKVARLLFNEVQDKIFSDSIRFLITGGSYISNDVLRLFNAIGYPLFNGYGMSEIGITSVELRKKAKFRCCGSIGKPFEKIKYRISENNTLEVLSESIANRIITQKEIINIDHSSWYNTNDIVSIDNLGYYYINGRCDDVVISESGEKINPDLVEKELYLPSVNRYCVIGLKHHQQTYLTLIVEINPNTSKLKIKRIVDEIENNLQKDGCLVEKVYYTNDSIASNQSIKVSRTILQKLINEKKINLISYQNLKELSNFEFKEIEDEIGEKIKLIMSEIIDVDPNKIGYNSHFVLDLGATSLDYLTLIVKLKEEFDMEFNFNGNDNCYNVEEFVKYIKNN